MIRIPTLLLTALLSSVSLDAQTSRPQTEPSVVEWPELSAKDASRTKFLIRKVITSGDKEEPEDVDELEAELIELGAGTVKALLRRLNGSDLPDDGHSRLHRVLDGVLEDRFAPLLVPYLTDKRVAVRRYVSGRIARAHDASLTPALKAALTDEDSTVEFHAALGLVGMADFEHFDRVFEECQSGAWREIAPLVAEVLEPVRSSEAKRRLDAKMRKADTLTLVTALRLMRSLCPKDLAGAVAFWLDSEESPVKKEAINALRAVVDGDPPLENLSVFQAIEQVKKWKARL